MISNDSGTTRQPYHASTYSDLKLFNTATYRRQRTSRETFRTLSNDLLADLMLGGVTDHSARDDGYRACLTEHAPQQMANGVGDP